MWDVAPSSAIITIILYLFRMKDLSEMFSTGFYLNDLSLHDCSRDFVLAGTNKSSELKLALDMVSRSQYARL